LVPSRRDLLRCRCGELLTDYPGIEVAKAAITGVRELEGWLKPDAPILAGMSGAARFWWAERLALAIAHTPEWCSQAAARFAVDRSRATDLVLWTAAAEVIHSWPDGFFQFLEAFQQVSKDPKRSTGVGRAFGRLLHETTDLEALGYPAPAETLRHYLLQRFTTGHITRKLGLFRERPGPQRLDERRWYTQTEAAALLQMRPPHIAILLRQGVLEGQLHPAGNRGRTIGLVSRSSVATLRQVLVSGLRVPELRRRLGIGTARARELIHSTCFGPPCARSMDGSCPAMQFRASKA
jgi:hypothetical protein